MSGIKTAIGKFGKAIGTGFTPRANIPRSDVQGAIEYVMDNAENVGTPYAPTDAQYLVSAGASGLSNERVVSDGVGISWDFSRLGTAVANLTHLGIEDLADPEADRIAFWDNSEGAFKWLEPTAGIAISGSTLHVSGELYDIMQMEFAPGDILYHDGDNMARLPSGPYAAFLKVGSGGIPEWESFPIGTGLGDVLSINNLSELTDKLAARENLGVEIGADVQAWSAGLDDISALDVTDGNIIVGDGANWVAESGTTARASLGLTIGTNVQAWSSDLDTIAGLSKADGNFIVANSTSWTVASGSMARASLGVYSTSQVDSAIDADVADALAILASTSNAQGATLIGIEDSAGLITSATVEGALAELASDVASLDNAVVLKGTWDASSGSFPGSGTAQPGWSYIVSVSGTVDGVDFVANDRILAIAPNASATTYAANWHKLDYTDQVLSVAGKTGAVTLAHTDISGLGTLATLNSVDLAANVTGDLPFANLAQIAGLSVLGVTGNSTADVAGIAAGTDHQVLRRSGTALAFGAVALNQSAAITGELPGANMAAASTTARGAIEIAVASEVRSAAAGNLAITTSLLESAAAGVAITNQTPATWNWDAGINFTLTISQNTQIATPTNGQPGTWRTILCQGNNTTDRTITFSGDYKGDVPTITDCDNGRWYMLMIYCISSTHFVVSSKKANGT